jgi:hypothetical protein
MDYRECWTCKKVLHKSEYYKEDIVKYFNCKVCERARLAKLRDERRYCKVDGRCCFCCPSCHKAVDMNKLVMQGLYSFYTCTCKAECRFKLCSKVNERTGHFLSHPTLRCQMCMAYGCHGACCSAKCLKKRNEAQKLEELEEGEVPKVPKVPKLVIKFNKK